MGVYRCQLMFEAGKAGWSETYYVQGVTISNARNSIIDMVPKRLAFLAAGNLGQGKIIGYRITGVQDSVASLVEHVEWIGADNDSQLDMPWTGITVALVDGSTRRHVMCCRGVGDEVFKGYYSSRQWPVWFFKAVQAWKDRIINSEFRGRNLDKSVITNPLKTITAITANNDDTITVEFSAAHNLETGDNISFYHVKAHACIRGSRNVTKVDATKVKVDGFNLATVGFISGFARKTQYVYSGFEIGELVSAAKRSAGRPFFLLRGRQTRC